MFDFEDIQVFPTPPICPPFWVWMSGISNCDGTYYIDRPCAETCVFEYIIQGTGTLELDDQFFTPSAGDMYILPLGSHQRYASSSHDPWKKIFFNLQGDAIPLFLKAYNLTGHAIFSNCESFYPLFQEFFQKTLQPIPVETIMEECCMLLHKILMRLQHRIQNPIEIPEEARKLKAYIDNKMNSSLSIEELAGVIYRSPDYTNKLFQKYYNETPYAYYIRRKIETAKILLSDTKLAINQIADRLGFKDPHYFSRQFHRHTGMTPMEYRKSGKYS